MSAGSIQLTVSQLNRNAYRSRPYKKVIALVCFINQLMFMQREPFFIYYTHTQTREIKHGKNEENGTFPEKPVEKGKVSERITGKFKVFKWFPLWLGNV